MFYFTDIHGNIQLFHAVVNWCKQQDPNCTIVFGGDAADRGEDGYQIIKELIADPQIIYLFGNHEQLFLKAAYEILGYAAQNDSLWDAVHNVKTLEQVQHWLIETIHGIDISTHLWNGGFPTLRDWFFDGANDEVITALEDLPHTYSYGVMDFCHAGGAYGAFQEIADAERQNLPRSAADRVILWDRDCCRDVRWADARICVHGHTPIQIFNPRNKNIWRPMVFQFDNSSTRINMDCGTAFSKYIYVLNCDTMKCVGFFDSGNNIEQFDYYTIGG